MPNYDFHCQKCDHKFTVMISIKDRENVTCPECKSARIKQLFTSFGIQVKGDGGGCGGSCSDGGFG